MDCITCGNEIPETTKKTYRPKQYCNSDCRNYMKYKNALESTILRIRPTKAQISVIRGDMFRLSNILSNGTFTKENT